MNIVYTLNDKFVPQVAAGICSVCENNLNASNINFYLISNEISDENKALLEYIPTSEYPNLGTNRLNLIHYDSSTPSELITTINYLWNYIIAMKKANMNVCVYIEGIDEFLHTPVTNDYLMELLNKCSKLKVPFTMTIQNCALLVANDNAKIELEYFLEKIEYFKILSMGVIERRIFKDKLNISNSIIPYITDKEPGEGIIITPTSNIAFNDRFLNMDNDFYKRFLTNV